MGLGLLHAVRHAWVHHRAAGQYDFLVQVTLDVKVTLEDQFVFVCSQQGYRGACYATLHMSSH